MNKHDETGDEAIEWYSNDTGEGVFQGPFGTREEAIQEALDLSWINNDDEYAAVWVGTRGDDITYAAQCQYLGLAETLRERMYDQYGEIDVPWADKDARIDLDQRVAQVVAEWEAEHPEYAPSWTFAIAGIEEVTLRLEWAGEELTGWTEIEGEE
jgi:hypothetical protein